MGAITFYNVLLFAVIIHVINLILPLPGEATTRWDGRVSLEDTNRRTPENNTNLFQARLDLDIKPPTKKRLDARFNIQLNFTESDEERLWNISPIGNLGVDLRGESYSLNLNHSNSANITSTAELVETRTSRAAFSLSPLNLPRVVTNYTTNTTKTEGKESESDIFDFFSDYSYKWMKFRGGYSNKKSFTDGKKTADVDSFFYGTGGSYEILPRTILTGDFDFNRITSNTLSGFNSETDSRAFRLSANSRPFTWFDLTGNFSKDTTDNKSGRFADTSSERRNMDLTARVYPFQSLEMSTTVGNRKFDDVEARQRDVDYTTVTASFRDTFQENIRVGLNVSRTTESDSDQGDNTRENFGFNSTLDLTPRMSARLNFNIGRSERPGFVSTATFDAAGTLAGRDEFDDRPPGFTYFDIDNNDLYTKNTSDFADWSDPVHISPETEQFSVSKTVQLNMVPTDKTSLVLSYTSNSADDKLDIAKVGAQNIRTSFSYRPNLRTSYSLSGTANLPQAASNSYAGTLTMSYRLFRGHLMSLSYSNRYLAGDTTDVFSGTFRSSLRKRTNLDIIYSTTQLFKKDAQTHYIRVTLSKFF